MSFEQRPNSGSLFKNDRKEKDTHPDYRGDALIDGKSYWVSCWRKESAKGTKYFSVAFKEKEARQEERPKTLAEKSPQPAGDFDDDLPF
jgi:uncharacterized protein (DUF736 family)